MAIKTEQHGDFEITYETDDKVEIEGCYLIPHAYAYGGEVEQQVDKKGVIAWIIRWMGFRLRNIGIYLYHAGRTTETVYVKGLLERAKEDA